MHFLLELFNTNHLLLWKLGTTYTLKINKYRSTWRRAWAHNDNGGNEDDEEDEGGTWWWHLTFIELFQWPRFWYNVPGALQANWIEEAFDNLFLLLFLFLSPSCVSQSRRDGLGLGGSGMGMAPPVSIPRVRKNLFLTLPPLPCNSRWWENEWA